MFKRALALWRTPVYLTERNARILAVLLGIGVLLAVVAAVEARQLRVQNQKMNEAADASAKARSEKLDRMLDLASRP